MPSAFARVPLSTSLPTPVEVPRPLPKFSPDYTALRTIADQGCAMSEANPRLAAARVASDAACYKWGFDIATALTRGTQEATPDSRDIFEKLKTCPPYPAPYKGNEGQDALNGFALGQSLQWGFTKAAAEAMPISREPSVAFGQLVATGIAGSSLDPSEKMGVIQTTVNASPEARAGVVHVIAKKKGVFRKLLELLGLA